MPRTHDFDDDLFASSRMTFGEHLEELRSCLIKAIKGLVLVVLLGFVLDAVGTFTRLPWLGVGWPMMRVITAPVKQALSDFYDRRLQRLLTDKEQGDEAAAEATARQPMKLSFSPEALAALRGTDEPPKSPIDVVVQVDPVEVYKSSQRVQKVVRPPELSTLSVTESMVVYVKVSLLCGLVLASPWVFWQAWSFVAAGLYPHEKHYVHKYLPMSLSLFLGGILLCQFAVIPRSIEALLWFNDWLGFAPDLRLNEWLGFAILLPLVFGISFQTPLVMLFLERIGVMTVATYLGAWRMAVFLLAVIAALITPTPDAFTLILMWAPLCGLYFFGIGLCYWTGRERSKHDDDMEDDVAYEA